MPLEDLLPDHLPAFVRSPAYFFGVITLSSLVLLILSGIVLAVFGPQWWHDNAVGHFVNSLHFWCAEAFFFSLNQVQALTEAGWAATAIAQALSDAGFRPSRSNIGFRAQTITQLQRQLGVRAPRPRVRQHDGLLPDEWWPTELVRTLFIPRGSLYHWIRQGLVRVRQLDEPLHRWVVWADEAEQERLREYHQRAIGDDFRHRWTDAPLAEQL